MSYKRFCGAIEGLICSELIYDEDESDAKSVFAKSFSLLVIKHKTNQSIEVSPIKMNI